MKKVAYFLTAFFVFVSWNISPLKAQKLDDKKWEVTIVKQELSLKKRQPLETEFPLQVGTIFQFDERAGLVSITTSTGELLEGSFQKDEDLLFIGTTVLIPITTMNLRLTEQDSEIPMVLTLALFEQGRKKIRFKVAWEDIRFN
ncbi:MAG: hypothetical protein AAFP02_11260, partial [Bacteroidota bacterium]